MERCAVENMDRRCAVVILKKSTHQHEKHIRFNEKKYDPANVGSIDGITGL